MAEVIFWTSLAGLGYVYFGYPLLLAVWSRWSRKPVHKQKLEPSVSLVIAMRNEQQNVERKMRNCFELDYPPDKLQLIVSLDGATDDTEAEVRRCGGSRVEVVCSSVHRGKAAALNSGVAMATGEIVVFADARQELEKRAVRELVANFADESVGAVSGELMLLDERGREASDGVGLYWRYEKRLRAMESDIHSVVGATGAIYAIRRRLYAPLPAETILDDVAVPMTIVLAGWRVVFDSTARAYDLVSRTPKMEYRRKARTLTGNYQLLVQMPDLLVPWRNPIFVQLVSHKLGRLLAPYWLAALLISNLFLLHSFYFAFFLAQLLWYLLAGLGWLASTFGLRPRTLMFPFTFVAMNWAALSALHYFLSGRRDIWTPAEARRP